MEMTKQDFSTIEAFVTKTLGKGFEISMNKLFQFKSTLSRTTEEEESKTYFCSELVARLYKEIGLLDPNKASTTYYPIDFSEKGSIRLIREGAILGPEHIISFDKHK